MRTIKTSLFSIFFLLATLCFGQQQPLNIEGNSWFPAEGLWIVKDNKLQQTDPTSPRAKINLKVDQIGKVEYQFSIQQLKGLEDGYGGVGIHIMLKNPNQGIAWGNGQSYLLWLTYNEKTYGNSSLRAQVYESINGSNMDLTSCKSLNCNQFVGLLYDFGIPIRNIINLNSQKLEDLSFSVRIQVNSDDGHIKIKDPYHPLRWWHFFLGNNSINGTHVSLRTSSLSAIFDDIIIFSVQNP